MRVFVTGATGFVGSAVVQELLQAGHQVLGLARSEEASETLLAAGAQVHRGSIYELESLRSGAANADGVIHTAFNHDFSTFKENCETDRRVIQTLGETLAGTKRPLVVTSGIGVLPPLGRLAVEGDMPGQAVNPRVASEEAADVVAAMGVQISIMRLPPSVHGAGDHGFVPMLIALAREKGVAVYTGEGLNRWPTIHRIDAARLFRRALEKTSVPGTRYHAIGEEGVAFRDIAQSIGKHLHLPVESKSPEEAAVHFGWFAHFAGMDCPASGKQTQEQLSWTATQPGLLADLDTGSYFI